MENQDGETCPMKRKFNDTGLCVPRRHYMVDTSSKIESILEMVDGGEYFIINRPRQFGKTTTLALLADRLNERKDYVALEISFEELDPDAFERQESFIYEVLMMLLNKLKFLGLTDPVPFLEQGLEETTTMPALSRLITKFMRDLLPGKAVVLLIDEVDKSSGNSFFLSFLGMLRNKYLQWIKDQDHTFQSVILAGVHDIKTLKSQIRPDAERRYNSPWNIAVDFKVDLSFAAMEIESMLRDYSREKGVSADIPAIAEDLYYYTSGYPYLVSKLCKFIDEEIAPAREDPNWTAPAREDPNWTAPAREDPNWTAADVETAFRMIVDGGYTTTLFDSMVKNLENNPELYDLVFRIVINGEKFPFSIADPVINLGHLYGIIDKSEKGRCRIHNRIFEQRIYDYMMSKFLRTRPWSPNGLRGPDFYTDDGLNIKLILLRFQIFMREHYSNKDAEFLEREGRMLFLSYLRPIINGRGFDFKEPNVGDERRMDIVITFGNRRHVLELKIWHGPKYHEEGLRQLSRYLDTFSLKEGYLLIFDFNRNKAYRQEEIVFENKKIFAVWV